MNTGTHRHSALSEAVSMEQWLQWRSCGCFQLFLFSLVVLVCAGSQTEPIELTEGKLELVVAVCRLNTSRSVASFELRQKSGRAPERGRLLQKMHARCTKAPCLPEDGVKVASAGVLRNDDRTSELAIAWTPSASLDLPRDPHRYNCSSVVHENTTSTTPSVRSVQVKSLQWELDKVRAGLPGETSLRPEWYDEKKKGWKPVEGLGEGGALSCERGGGGGGCSSSVTLLYGPGTPGVPGVMVLQMVVTPKRTSFTVLVSNDSSYPSDPAHWRFQVDVGGSVRDCVVTSSSSSSPSEQPGESGVNWRAIAITFIVASLLLVVVIIIIIIIFIYCRHRRCCCCHKGSKDTEELEPSSPTSANMLPIFPTPTQVNDVDIAH
ncbi:uncharacterized protein LOC143282485 [Babylonia areolata]|uniref:uncharacterized protein LOC143282485 n=1 Tax=Babylonia areolata TaxID=304850 RepID=UPI003FD51D1B